MLPKTIITPNDMRDWLRASVLGKVCGIYGCENEPITKCGGCGKYYCTEHSAIHFDKIGRFMKGRL